MRTEKAKLLWNVFIGRESESFGNVVAKTRNAAYTKARAKFSKVLSKPDPLTGKPHTLFVTQSAPGS